MSPAVHEVRPKPDTTSNTALLQNLVHDEGVDESQSRMTESGWNSADDLEPHVLPETDGTLVRGHDQVVLHGPVPVRDGLHLRVLTHSRGDAFTSRMFADDVAAVADV